jgi:hypothetical protein
MYVRDATCAAHCQLQATQPIWRVTDGHAAQATEHALAQNGHYTTFKNHQHSKLGLYPRTMH